MKWRLASEETPPFNQFIFVRMFRHDVPAVVIISRLSPNDAEPGTEFIAFGEGERYEDFQFYMRQSLDPACLMGDSMVYDSDFSDFYSDSIEWWAPI